MYTENEDKQQITAKEAAIAVSKLWKTSVALKYLWALFLLFILFSQLSIVLRKNFSVLTFPISTYTTELAEELIWNVSDEEWSSEDNWKAYAIADKIIEWGWLISPWYLWKFSTDDSKTIIDKNFSQYSQWWFELSLAKWSDKDWYEWRIAELLTKIKAQEKDFWDAYKKIFLSDETKKYLWEVEWELRATYPIISNNEPVTCLKNNWGKWEIETAGICARKWMYLALRSYLLESLDKTIAFPMVYWENKKVYLKKFDANGNFTNWYLKFIDFLKEKRISDMFFQDINFSIMNNGVDRVSIALKNVAAFNLVYEDIFKRRDTTKEMKYVDSTLYTISSQESHHLPKFVTLKQEKAWEEKEKKDLDFDENGIITVVWNENDKNTIAFELVNSILSPLVSHSYNYFNDILNDTQNIQLQYDNSKQEGCVLTLWGWWWQIIYPTINCDGIQNMLWIQNNVVKTGWGIVEWALNKASETVDGLLTNNNRVQNVKWVNFRIPAFWVMSVNGNWVGFWIRGIEETDTWHQLVVKNFLLNITWDKDKVNSTFAKIGSFTVQLLYYSFYVSLYIVFIGIVSVLITLIFNYQEDKKNKTDT